VKAAACCVQEHRDVKHLIGFIVPKPGVDQSNISTTLRDQLRQSLPFYMIPDAIECLEQLPTSLAGKTDRKRLPKIDISLVNIDDTKSNSKRLVQFRAASTPSQKSIEKAFAMILNVIFLSNIVFE
jgi:hypothetical protein